MYIYIYIHIYTYIYIYICSCLYYIQIHIQLQGIPWYWWSNWLKRSQKMSVAKQLDTEDTSKLRDFWQIVDCFCLRCQHLFQARTSSMQAGGQRLDRKSDFALETENFLVFWTRSKAMSNQRAFFHVFPRYLWLSVASWLLNLSTIPVHSILLSSILLSVDSLSSI